ncbi:hypothetical protein KUTeg_006609 [Tegillarca granosa]|uniref:Uncharacterized protein n=1 Tax=Tegillarca granosa TaxID=220873 RepID=A0ABQ9FAS6_TEGGR|nr:hypothetical protein KUTeg_006609 [Tegillarca granosa]
MADSDEEEVSSTTDDPVVSSVGTLISSTCNDEIGVTSVDSIVKVDIPDDGTLSADALTVTSVSPSMANPTLHGLLSTPVSITNSQLLSPDGVQIIAVSNPNEFLTAGATPDGRVWQVVHPEMATIIAVAADPSEFEQKSEMSDAVVDMDESDSVVGNEMSAVAAQDAILMPPPPPPAQTQSLPPDCPVWAQRMKCCEKIGDSFRGYVETEAELDLLLTYHKQHTQSFWGTRQSPSPAKPSTRLMWKSQYVPFDGQPFINSGSRAVVMECQIYIKKVKKFPEYAVDLNIDKKSLKTAMDKAFHELKHRGTDGIGQERTYVSRDLYHGGEVPERHDLTLFPTVNVELLGSSEPAPSQIIEGQSLVPWQTAESTCSTGDEESEPVPETVTVTLTQNPGDDGHHVISRIETHLSDGSTRISTTLTPETAQLLSRLHPNMFPANLLLQQQMDQAVSSISDTNGVVLKTEDQSEDFTSQGINQSVTGHDDNGMVHGDSDIGNRDDILNSDIVHDSSTISHSDSVLGHSDSVIHDADSVISVHPLQIDDNDITSTREGDRVESLNSLDITNPTEGVSSDVDVNMSADDTSHFVSVSLSSDAGDNILGESSHFELQT